MIITKTPLRISFVGGGSDQREYYKNGLGAVVSTTIDKYVYVSVNHRFDGMIRVSYSKSETVDSVNKVEHDIIREAMKITGVLDSIEVTYIGDIPIGRAGTGLGSSSALAVGILNALHAYKGRKISPKTLAEQACQIEIDILKRPIGKQDQYAVAYGGLNHIFFKSDNSVNVRPISLTSRQIKKINGHFLLFHTNLPTQSSTVLQEQKEKTRSNFHHLKEMAEMTHEIKRVIKKGDLKRIGEVIHQNWMKKKLLASQISNSTIDAYYEKALAAGAIGGKILGSGGGGFLFLVCPKKNQTAVRKALKGLTEVRFSINSKGTSLILNEKNR